MTRLIVCLNRSRVLWVASKRSRKAEKLARLVAAGAMVALLAGCAPVLPPPQPEFCQLVGPHQFSNLIQETLRIGAKVMKDPDVAADLDYLTDLSKTRRCLCGGAQDGCPE